MMHIIGELLAAVVGIANAHFGAWQPWFADTPAAALPLESCSD